MSKKGKKERIRKKRERKSPERLEEVHEVGEREFGSVGDGSGSEALQTAALLLDHVHTKDAQE